VAFQECSWLPEVINGSVKSSAGAVGIMQLEPRFFPGAGLNWRDDVVTGARELARLYEHFKDWQQAIAAYNFGQGHIDRLVALDAHLASGKELQDLPLETRNYVTQVFSDVPIRGAILNAA
jgi:soluble lytic murein transglycosylase-like protein